MKKLFFVILIVFYFAVAYVPFKRDGYVNFMGEIFGSFAYDKYREPLNVSLDSRSLGLGLGVGIRVLDYVTLWLSGYASQGKPFYNGLIRTPQQIVNIARPSVRSIIDYNFNTKFGNRFGDYYLALGIGSGSLFSENLIPSIASQYRRSNSFLYRSVNASVSLFNDGFATRFAVEYRYIHSNRNLLVVSSDSFLFRDQIGDQIVMSFEVAKPFGFIIGNMKVIYLNMNIKPNLTVYLLNTGASLQFQHSSERSNEIRIQAGIQI